MSRFDILPNRKDTDSVAWSRFKDTLPLWVADMDFEAPSEIVEAIKKRADLKTFGYGDGYPELRQEFANRQKDLFNWEVHKDEVKCTAGILPVFYALINFLSKPDEAVLLFTPAYPPFFKLIKQSGRELIECQLSETRENNSLSYQIDFDKLNYLVTVKTRVLTFCSPHNPVGKLFTRSELEQLSEFCLKRKILIISDEIHSELTFNHTHIPTASISKEVSDITITLSGPSKTFNLPGLKLGMVTVQNNILRREIFDMAAEAIADISPLSAAAALAAYRSCTYWKSELLDYLKSNREFTIEFIRANLPLAELTFPESTYLLWINLRAYKGEKSPFEKILNNKVSVGDGKNFGKQYGDFIRISLACPRAMLEEALSKIASAIINS